MRPPIILIGLSTFFALCGYFISVNLAMAKVICVDKYNYASIVPCSDQNAIDRDTINGSSSSGMSSGANMTLGNATAGGNMTSGNMTATPSNATTSNASNNNSNLMPYQTPAINGKCTSGPVNVTISSAPTCGSPSANSLKTFCPPPRYNMTRPPGCVPLPNTSSSPPLTPTSENNVTRTKSDLVIAQQGGSDSGCTYNDKSCLEIWSAAYLSHHPNLSPSTQAFWLCMSHDYGSEKCYSSGSPPVNSAGRVTGLSHNFSHRSGHTADYWYGYRIGQEDGRSGVFDIGDSCNNTPEHNWSHCAAGYTDGYKSICGTTYSRVSVACNSGPS